MLLPIILIVSVALGNVNAFVAMWMVVIFHLLAMVYIIKTYKYNKVKK
jgi:hypothetical protein